MADFKMDDYVDVAERIQDFMDATGGVGTLQRVGEPTLMVVADRTFIMYTAAAYRTPDDPRPGIGTAWEPIPGPTKFTKDSELMNAETAAWGRAIVATGCVANRKLASRQEVRARMSDAEQEKAGFAPVPDNGTVPAPKPVNKPEPTIGPDAVAELSRLYAATNWKGDASYPDDVHALLRMQLAAVGAGNEGEIVACIKALTVSQAATVKAALQEARS